MKSLGFVLLKLLEPIKILSDQLKDNYQKLLRIEINFNFCLPKILKNDEKSLSFCRSCQYRLAGYNAVR